MIFLLSRHGDANPQAIAASVMLDRSLHTLSSETGNGRTTHAWHVAFLLCLCLSTQSASSSCERIGSLLHGLEDGESRIAAARIADRLRLRVSGFEAVGGARDELLIDTVVETIGSDKNPIIQRAAAWKRRKKGQEDVGSLSVNIRVQQSNEKAQSSMLPLEALPQGPVAEDSLNLLHLVCVYKC